MLRRSPARLAGAACVAVGLAAAAIVAPPTPTMSADEPSPDETPAVAETTIPENTIPETTVPDTSSPAATDPDTERAATPATNAPESAVPADGSESTTTTIEQPTEPEVTHPAVPLASSFTASALAAYSLSITDPFAVSPTSIDFGSYFVGARAQEIVTLLNDTGREVYVEVTGAAGATVNGLGGCGTFLPPDGVIASLYLDIDTTCEVYVEIDATSPASISGRLDFTDTDSSATASVEVTAEVVPVAAPANDNWVNAEDLSPLAIPPFVTEPGQFPGTVQPRDTLQIDGTTENATYETGEYDPGRGGGSLWYKYTSPPGGFAGRLGYRATPGFFVLASTENTSATDSRQAQGNTWPPSSIRHVWMEPGHTVWFSVYNEFVDPGRFTLELFQASDEQDSIVEAYSGTGSGEFALSSDFNLIGNGDTHHLTADVGGAPNGWSTLRFAVPGSLSVTYRSATAATAGAFGGAVGSERPLGLRIYRSPQPTLVSDPTLLGAAIAVGSGAISNDPAAFVDGSRFETTATVAVTPGRYYWTYEQGTDPTFFVSDVQFRAGPATDTEPPTATITTPPDGAEFAVGAVPSSVVSSCTDNQGPATSFITVDGTETTSLATLPGSHTVSLECTDAAGNMVAVTSTYTVVTAPDVTAPETVIESVTVSGRDVSVVVSATDDRPGGVSFECALSPTSTLGFVPGSQVWRPCVSPVSYTNLAEGYYVVVVRARDAAGNVDATPAVRAFTVDVSPPVVQVGQPVDGAVYAPGTVPILSAACTDLDIASFSWTVNGAPYGSVDLPQVPGVYTVAVRCVDQAGLETQRSVTYTVPAPDTTPPTISISGIAPGATVSSTAGPTVTVTSNEVLVNVICTVGVVRDDTGASSSNDVGCLPAPPTSGGSFTFPTLPDGAVTLTVQGFDAAGNVATATLSFDVQVDPVVTITAPADGATYAPGQVPALAYTCTDSAGVVDEIPSLGANGDPWPGAPPSTTGTWRINVDCLDGAGNGGTASVTYSVVAPDVTAPETVIDSVTVSGRDVSVVVSATDDGAGALTLECAVTDQLGFVPGSEVWRPCVSPVSYTNLAEGYYLVSVRASDAAGNVDATPAIRAFTVDVSPPEVVLGTPVDGSTYLPGEVVELSAVCTDLDIASFTFTVNGTPLVGIQLPTTPGDYLVAVRCVDQVGLETTRTASYTVPVPDTTPPTITITGIAPGGVVTDAAPSVTITSDEPLANVICTLDLPTPAGGTLSNDIGCFTPGYTSDTLTFPDLPDGLVTLTVSGQDEAGNDTTVTLTFSVEVLPTASITAPADGATYFSSEVPTSVSYVCADNGVITTEEVQLVPQDGGPPALLVGPPPNTAGIHTIRVVCVDGLGEEATASVTYTVVVLGLTVSATPTPVAIGDLFEYVVVVTNPSPSERARGMRLQLVMPPGAGTTALTQLPPLSGCSFSPALGSGPSGTPAVTVDCSFADLAPNSVTTFRVRARPLPGSAGSTLSAAATLSSSDCLDVDPVATGSQCLSPVVGGPVVTSTTLVPEVVQVSPAPGTPLRVGDLVRQRFRVTNTGGIAAGSTRMVVTFPAELGVTKLPVMPPLAGCSFSPPLGAGGFATPGVTVSCSVGAVAPGGVRDVEIEARVLGVPVAPAAPVLFDVGSSDCPDTSPRAGVQCATIAVGRGVDRVNLTPAVRVERVGGGTTFAVGDEVRVVATVTNTSAIPARTPTVRIALPADLAVTALESLPPLSGCSFSPALAPAGTPSVTVSCSQSTLAASTTATYTLRARVLAVPGSPFSIGVEAGSRDCRDQTVGDGRQVCATAVNATPVVGLATSSGDLTLQVRSLGGGSPVFGSIQSIAPSLLGVRPPAGVGFPYGAMSFSVYDVPVGGSVTVDITAPSAVGGYWKLVNGTWSLYPGATPIPGTTTGLRLTLVDGGLGDADGVANGVIVDPGAIGVPNVGPTAPDRTVSTPTDTPVTIDVLIDASDPDGGVSEVVDATDGTAGTVTVTASDVTYTPDPGTYGDDTFTVRIGDGQGGTTTVTVTVQVGRPDGPPAPPPVVPVGVADAYQTTAGTTLGVSVPGVLTNDAGANLMAALVTGPSVGSLSLRADGSFTFVAPPTAPAGTVSFTYRPTGPSGVGAETTVSIDVRARDDMYAPLVSVRRDRGAPTPLGSGVLSGQVAIFVPTAREIARVEWFLDDPAMTGRPRQVERLAPYDFNGTAPDGRAQLFSTRLLADGPHTVTARVVSRDGPADVVSSTFLVSNPRPETRVLSFSTRSRRTNPAPLDAATVTRPIAVFVPTEPDIASVRFSVDGVLRSTERFAAYDLGTTNPNGTARLVRFPLGDHLVTARIAFDDGFVDTLTARFTVPEE